MITVKAATPESLLAARRKALERHVSPSLHHIEPQMMEK